MPFVGFLQELEADERLIEFLVRLKYAKQVNLRFCKAYRIDTIGLFRMTPQEEKFSKFFAEEAILVSSMDDIALAAHREELASIAFEARARLHAVDEENRERTKKGRKFTISDDNAGADISSDAINNIRERQKKMTKLDKVKQSLINMGVDPTEADRIISARNIRDNRSTGDNASKVINPFAGSATNPPEFKEPKKKLKPGEIDWEQVVEEAKAKEAAVAEAKPFELPKFG